MFFSQSETKIIQMWNLERFFFLRHQEYKMDKRKGSVQWVEDIFIKL